MDITHFFFYSVKYNLETLKLILRTPPKSEYFFQQHWESEYFFRKKNPNPPPPPLQVKWSFPKSFVKIVYTFTICYG